MTDSEQSVRRGIAMKLDGEIFDRLEQLGREQGVTAPVMARMILDEIVPKIETAHRRTVIKLRQASANGNG